MLLHILHVTVSGLRIQYIPRNMHTVFALLCFVVVIHWLIFPYPSGLLHWHCGNLTIAPVPAKQPWWIWINTSCEFIMNDCITTTKQSTTKPCAYFLGYTVALSTSVTSVWFINTKITLKGAHWLGKRIYGPINEDGKDYLHLSAPYLTGFVNVLRWRHNRLWNANGTQQLLFGHAESDTYLVRHRFVITVISNVTTGLVRLYDVCH